MSSFVNYGALLIVVWPMLSKRWQRIVAATVTVALVLAIGASRVLLGVHYPSDVIGGYILGAAWLSLMLAAFHTEFAKGQQPRSTPGLLAES
jgi:undecaprenyl-diphosphatase